MLSSNNRLRNKHRFCWIHLVCISPGVLSHDRSNCEAISRLCGPTESYHHRSKRISSLSIIPYLIVLACTHKILLGFSIERAFHHSGNFSETVPCEDTVTKIYNDRFMGHSRSLPLNRRSSKSQSIRCSIPAAVLSIFIPSVIRASIMKLAFYDLNSSCMYCHRFHIKKS